MHGIYSSMKFKRKLNKTAVYAAGGRGGTQTVNFIGQIIFIIKVSLPLARNPHFAWGSDRYSSNLTQFSLQREEEMVSSSTCLCILEEGQFSFDEGVCYGEIARSTFQGLFPIRLEEWFPYEKSLPR